MLSSLTMPKNKQDYPLACLRDYKCCQRGCREGDKADKPEQPKKRKKKASDEDNGSYSDEAYRVPYIPTVMPHHQPDMQMLAHIVGSVNGIARNTHDIMTILHQQQNENPDAFLEFEDDVSGEAMDTFTETYQVDWKEPSILSFLSNLKG